MKFGRSDCLLKTQDFANYNMMYKVWDLPSVKKLRQDVYALNLICNQRRL